MQNKVFIKEIFESIQGEGPYIGVNQLFIRFSKCNLNCRYCDTDFKSDLKEYSVNELLWTVNQYKNIHSVSLTGGEPLCDIDFLLEFLPLTDKKVYLETNGTLFKNLEKIINNIDIVSMDIKLPSACKMKNFFTEHENFIKICVKHNKKLFLKIVFDKNITSEEINKTTELAEKYDLLAVLQPKTENGRINIPSDFINKIYGEYVKKHIKTRLIPQVHKFLDIR